MSVQSEINKLIDARRAPADQMILDNRSKIANLTNSIANLDAVTDFLAARIDALEDVSSPTTFMSRPSSPPIVYDGEDDLLIENIAITGNTLNDPTGIGITIRNAQDVTLRNIDLEHLQGGIYLYNVAGRLIFDNIRSRNVGTKTAENNDIGSGKSNHIQMSECLVSGYLRNCKFVGGRTEDMVSIYRSGGLSNDKFVVEQNAFQGFVSDTAEARAWDSASGTGIIIGDGPGSSKNGNVIVRNNTFLTPGQVGIQHIDGAGIETYENVIYGAQRAQSNNPMTSWEGAPYADVHDNRYYWFHADGHLVSPWWYGGGQITDRNNSQDATIDPADLVVNL